MKKFTVKGEVDYVEGHLRYGHLEGVIVAETEEEAISFAKEDKDFLDLVVDSYEVEDYGDVYSWKATEVKDEENKTEPYVLTNNELNCISRVFQNYYNEGLEEITEIDEHAKSLFEKIGLF